MSKNSRSLSIYFAVLALVSIAGQYVHASEFRSGTPNGAILTKGEVVMTLAKNPKAIVYKIDQVELDTKKGTVKTMKKD